MQTSEEELLRERVNTRCLSLPEAQVERPSGLHSTFLVRGKKFAYYLVDHHGDGRITVCARVAPGEQYRLAAEDPGRFFVPSYIGPRGWAGYYLDGADVDWDVVERLVADSYLMAAPKRLAAQLRRP
ncbi:hypothetical protein AYO38_05835 [bacterium SCGC AG-212-C10]|nr:hypothetical protein AYO38_05835 [bacterium SCGC AG-212-C10]